jgi:hypothetical protein
VHRDRDTIPVVLSNIMVLLGLSKTRAIVLYTISLRWASAGAQARGRAEATHGTTTEARG